MPRGERDSDSDSDSDPLGLIWIFSFKAPLISVRRVNAFALRFGVIYVVYP